MHIDVVANSVPERERFDAWHSALSDRFATMALPPTDTTRPFWGRFFAADKGPLLHSRIGAAGYHVFRGRRQIAHKQFNGYWIYRELGPGVWFNIQGEEFATRTGDFFIFDTEAELETRSADHFARQVWMLPKPMVERHLPKPGPRRLCRLSSRAGVDAIATSYLMSLSENWDDISEDAAGPVAETLARLLGLVMGAAIPEHPDAIRAGRLAQAKRYIEGHLADPALSPAVAASALGISVRTLHALFEPTGESFARHVSQGRIEECRSALLANRSRSVTDIAFAWGFNHLSAFYRAFQAAFAMSPGELRAAAARGERV